MAKTQFSTNQIRKGNIKRETWKRNWEIIEVKVINIKLIKLFLKN